MQSQSRVRFFGGLGGGSDLHRDFHSTPDLNVQAQSSTLAPKGHRSQEDVNALNGRNGLPPPNHPPPPPPVGQVVKVNVGANVPDVVTPASVYDNMAHIQQVKGNLINSRNRSIKPTSRVFAASFDTIFKSTTNTWHSVCLYFYLSHVVSNWSIRFDRSSRVYNAYLQFHNVRYARKISMYSQNSRQLRSRVATG